MNNDHLMHTYARLPVAMVRGEGAWLWDENDRRYLDAMAGIAVCALGHAHPAVTRALCEQAGRLIHASNVVRLPLQARLAERLTALAGMDRAFFCNSGAEANEAALKLARLQGRKRGIDKPAVVVMEKSFHGRTLATLSASGSRRVQAGFEPLVRGFRRVPFNDLGALETVARNEHDVVAVLVEPVLGEGGVIVPRDGYLAGLRRVCDEHDWLLMLDEIQTGMCRTGKWFAWQHEGARPDVMTVAKALANGVPIGACLAQGAAAELFQTGNHGSTFGGNPLACAAALAVLDVMEQGDLAARASATGAAIRDGLSRALDGVDVVRAVRGRGMMIGVELARPCRELVGRALEKGVMLNVTANNVVRLLPPLIYDDEQAAQLVDTVAGIVIEFGQEPVP
jgi:acetylornithine aminotransferase